MCVWVNMVGFPTKSGLFYLFRQKNTELLDTVVYGGLAVGSVSIATFSNNNAEMGLKIIIFTRYQTVIVFPFAFLPFLCLRNTRKRERHRLVHAE